MVRTQLATKNHQGEQLMNPQLESRYLFIHDTLSRPLLLIV